MSSSKIKIWALVGTILTLGIGGIIGNSSDRAYVKRVEPFLKEALFRLINREPVPDKSLSTIVGERWDENQAKKIALDILKRDYNESGSNHFFVESNPIFIDGEQMFIILTGSNFGQECRACSSELSVFEYKRLSGEWKLDNYNFGITFVGSGPYISSDLVKVEEIGDDIYAIHTIDPHLNRDYNTTIENFLSKLGDSWLPVLCLWTMASDAQSQRPGLNQWKAKIDFLDPMKNGFPNVSVSLEGIVDGKSVKDEYLFNFQENRYLLDAPHLSEYIWEEEYECYRTDLR